MTTNKFSKYVIDNIVVGTPISSIIAAGATIGLDSAAVIDLIDSDYIQQRESSGLDSAEVIALIDSDYVAARTPASNGAGLDSAATLDLLSYGIQNVGSNQKQVAISLNTFVDPFDQTGTADRSFNLNYTSTTGMFVRETGGRTEIHADASGTGQSTGLLLTGASFGNNGTEIAGNLKLSSLPTSDPSESGLLWNDGGIPVFSGSTAPIVSESLDSADVAGIVDSAYVQARQTPQDFAYSSLTGAPTALSSFTNDTNYITAADIPATVDSDYVAARAPAAAGGLEGFDVSQYDSATSNGIFEYNVSPGNQLRHLYSLNDAVSPTAYDGSLEHQVSWTISSNQQFGFRDAGGFRTKVNALANGSTATTGLVLEGETFNNSGVELVGNVKLSSLPTSDPSEIGLLWNDGGIPVFSGSTAPAGGFDANTDTIAIGSGAAANVNAVAIGVNADATDNNAIAIGNGASGNASHAIAIGLDAYAYNFGIAIGKDANGGANGSSAVVIGQEAGGQNIGIRSVAIGFQSGGYTHGAYSPKVETTHIGGYAGRNDPQAYSTGIGAFAGGTTQGTEAVAVGRYAANNTQGANAVAIGSWAAQTSQPANSIAISAIGNTPTGTAPPDGQYGIKIQTSDSGSLTYDTTNDWTFGATVNAPAFVGDGSGLTGLPSGGGLDSAGVQTLIDADLVGSGLDAVQIGLNSIASGSRSISIGPNAAATNQNNIAIGNSAGDAGSDPSTIAIGQLAKGGNQTGDTGSVAIGQGAGQYIQGPYTVAIGMNAGRGGGNTALRQQSGAVAAGYQSGYSEQGENGIAIGREAGWTAQGDNSIAIGYLTGKSGQGANNISINATGAAVNRLDQFGIDIRTSAAGSLTYDTTNDWTFGAGVTMTDLVASGATVVFNNLPTVDPVNAGQLWNDAGTMKISAG